jgi:fatty acid-binding protein DegV
MPLFVLEQGQLIATQKARSSRHLVDCMHEFVGEFDSLEHIAVVQGVPPFEQEVRSLRERFSLEFGAIPVSEHTIGPSLASLLGPRSLGLFVMEREF